MTHKDRKVLLIAGAAFGALAVAAVVVALLTSDNSGPATQGLAGQKTEALLKREQELYYDHDETYRAFLGAQTPRQGNQLIEDMRRLETEYGAVIAELRRRGLDPKDRLQRIASPSGRKE